MKIKTLKTASLSDALMEMKIGETAFAPVGYKPKTVMVEYNKLKKSYLFMNTGFFQYPSLKSYYLL